MSKKLSHNYAWIVASEIVSYIIPLIRAPYLSRTLGVAPLGDYQFTMGIVSYFIMFANLGTVNYAKREIAFRQNDIRERSKLFLEIFLFRLGSTFLSLIAYAIFLIFFSGELHSLYLIQLLAFAAVVFDITWLFHGVEEFRSVVIRNTIIKLVGTAAIFLFVKSPDDLWIYVLALSLITLLCSLSLWPSLKNYIVWTGFKDLHISRHFKGVAILFASTIAVQLYTVLDQTMLGVMTDNTQVGYYGQALKIINMVLMVLSSLTVVLLPRVAVLYKEKNETELRQCLSSVFNYFFFLAIPLTIGCFIVSPDFVPVFFGDGYEPVIVLLRILSFLFCILGMGQIFGTLLTAIDKQVESTIAVSIGAVINITLNCIMIHSLQSVGVCIASVAAEAIVTTIELRYINKHLDCVNYITNSFIHYIIPSVIMGCAVFAVHKAMNPGIIKLILEILAGMITYIGILYTEKDPMLIGAIGSISNKISGLKKKQ